MHVLPAVDIRDGRAVRLRYGDFEDETVYGADPVRTALYWVDKGARWLHVVDLDAARTGKPANRGLVHQILRLAPVPVQVGGGVRTEGDALELLEAGARRVVLGTVALEDPRFAADLCAAYPKRIALGLDVRDGELATHGWTSGTGRRLQEAVTAFAAAEPAAFVVTSINRDGALAGPDTALYGDLLAETTVPIVASGGVATLADVAALAALDVGGRRLAGAIVGRALYEGTLSLPEALAVAAS